jgi:GT2 family glycosyltransferase
MFLMSQTSVVIINYNNSKFLDKCLKSVIKNNPKEIIFVDDFSIKIAEKYINQIIKNGNNLGPVKSRNIGAKNASGKYILFLDSDIELEPNYIEESEKYFESNKKAGVLTGKIMDSRSNERIWYNFGHDPNKIKDLFGHPISILIAKFPIFNFLKPIAKIFTLNFVKDEEQKVDWAVGMALFTRKNVFEKVGGFDENYFMFFEEPDYCRMIKREGFYSVYIPQTGGLHLDGHSHKHTRRKIFSKSRKYYFKKWSK